MPDIITLALAKAYTNSVALGQGADGGGFYKKPPGGIPLEHLAATVVDCTTQQVIGGEKKFAEHIEMLGHKIVGMTDPENPQDAATKSYVDTQYLHKFIFTFQNKVSPYDYSAGYAVVDLYHSQLNISPDITSLLNGDLKALTSQQVQQALSAWPSLNGRYPIKDRFMNGVAPDGSMIIYLAWDAKNSLFYIKSKNIGSTGITTTEFYLESAIPNGPQQYMYTNFKLG